VISAIGNTVADNFQSLRQGRSGIGRITLFDTVHRDVLPVGEVKLTNNILAFRTKSKKTQSRTTLLGLHAAQEAIGQSGLHNRLGALRVGLISATTVGGMDRTENFFPAFLQDITKGRLRDVVDHACGRSTERIADALGIRGFVTTINTACSSSVNAIQLGARLIAAGQLDAVVAGGTDALTRFTLNGFNSLMILDPTPCRPFDAGRKGLNLGEGAGFVVLASAALCAAERLTPLATVAGFANTNDAFHQTASSPEGRGSFAAMEKALAMAGLEPADIGYINLHGTGTQNNDLSEGTAVKRLFAGALPPLSSTKAYTGHTLGASGGIEAVYSVLALREQCVFPNLRFETPMPELGLVPQQTFEHRPLRHVMSNSFGFGGNCSSIVLSTPV
jgi:3-oxoacyl-[acyl-carrier-protein] synthase-1